MEPKQVIVMRIDTDPKMRKGKMIAQGAHASLAVLLESFFGEYNNRNWELDIVSKKAFTKKVCLFEDDPLTEWINNSFSFNCFLNHGL